MTCNKMKDKMLNLLNVTTSTILVIVIVAFTLSLRKNLLSPVEAGFFCADPSIRYPIKNESVPTNTLVAVGVIAALSLTLLLEYLDPIPKIKSQQSRRKICGQVPPMWLLDALKSFGFFLLGLCITALLVELGKLSTGILRPNFMAVCRPNITCKDEDPHKYQTEYECLNATEKEADDGRKSFPSGHAAAVSFMAMFFVIYMQMKSRAFLHCYMMRPFLQLICISLAWITSLTRVSDHVHHISDVIVGFFIGGLLAVWSICCTIEATANKKYTDDYFINETTAETKDAIRLQEKSEAGDDDEDNNEAPVEVNLNSSEDLENSKHDEDRRNGAVS